MSRRRKRPQMLAPQAWNELLADYEAEHAPKERTQVNWFREQSSIGEAIQIAARAVDRNGRRFDHQRRIRKQAIDATMKVLLANSANIGHTRRFGELLELLEHLLSPINGIGELYCYDCAARIGAYLNISPDRVYLHAGTRKGARVLGLAYQRRSLEVTEMPEALQSRSPRELENILCIYASDFTNLAQARPCRR